MHAACLIVILLAVGAVFGPSLRHDFVWDDRGLIVANENVQSPGAVGRAFRAGFWSLGNSEVDTTRSFYRPLITLSYATDFALWGLRPAGFRLTNLLWHAAAAWMVFLVARRLFDGTGLPLVLALAFAVHPARVENVVWISGRTDVFCGALYLVALLLLTRWLQPGARRTAWGAAVLLAYLAALMAKEMALTFPLVAGLWVLSARAPTIPRRDATLLGCGLVLTTAAYLLAREAVLGQALAPPSHGTLRERLLSVPLVALNYIGVQAGIVSVDPHHATAYIDSLWPALGLALVLGVPAGYLVVRLARRRAWRALVLLSWAPVTLVPVLRLGAFGDVLHADRFLYIPSIGIVLFAGAAWRALLRHTSASSLRRVGPLLAVLYLLGMAGASLAHARYWRSDLHLFARLRQTSPESAYIRYNLGNALAREGQLVAAARAYDEALQLGVRHSRARTNLGITLLRLGRHAEALAVLQSADAAGDRSALLAGHLAEAHRAVGDLPAAETWAREALRRETTATTWNNLGVVLEARGELDDALHAYRASLSYRHEPAVAANAAGVALELGRPLAAWRLLQPYADEAREASPALSYQLVRVLVALEREAEAARHARRLLDALARAPDSTLPESRRDWLRAVAHGTASDAGPTGGVNGSRVPSLVPSPGP